MARPLTRQTQLASREDVKKQLLKLYQQIEDGFVHQRERSDDNLDYWDMYNCKLNSKQFYTGNAALYVPLVHNAIEARKTRFLGRIFPQSGRYVEVTTNDDQIPHATMSLLEGYVDAAKLRTKVVPAMLVAGDIEGGYALCATWASRRRHTVARETRPIRIGGIEHPDLGDEEITRSEVVSDAGPEVDLVADNDFLILPETAESVEDALDEGGSVTGLCRWSEARVEELTDKGEIDSDLSAKLLTEWKSEAAIADTGKKLAEAAGIKAGGKFALVYRTWTHIKIGKERRLVLAYFGGPEKILGCRLCPYWNDKPDYIYRPVKKMPGVAKGMSQVKPCADMQYMANDFANMGADTGIYAVNPVVLTDPEKNPRVGSMVLDTMAVWETSPKDTQVLSFPPVYEHAFNIIQAAERYINQTLSVNPSMIPQSTGLKSKRNQAEIAMEQQVDLLTTDDAVAIIEGVLTEVIERFAEYDAQFRDYETTVRTYGELGTAVEMETVPPISMSKKWVFRWFGVEQSRNAAQNQQRISGLNVMMNPALTQAVAKHGYEFNPIPTMLKVIETTFGERDARLSFRKVSDKYSVDPEVENMMMEQHHQAAVSPFDDHQKHIQVHMQLGQSPDPIVQHNARVHIQAHQQAMQMQAMAMMMQQAAQAMQGGGGGAVPGQPRQARAGAQPQMPRTGQQPAGAIHRDRLPKAGGVVQMPRRAG